jgi:hypothetical protein
MISQSNSSTKIAICFFGILAAAATTQANVSTLPQRYRNANGKVQQQRKSGTVTNGIKTRQEKETRKLVEQSLSMPSLDQASFDLSSMPITESRFDLSSMPITESRFDLPMSMPITQLEFDSSMSMMSDPPTESIGIGALSSDEKDGNKVILSSFLAGIGALVVAVAAMFVKMRRARARTEESQTDNEEHVQVESFASYDDMDDPEEGGLRTVRIH